jgi:hypothetical protein
LLDSIDRFICAGVKRAPHFLHSNVWSGLSNRSGIVQAGQDSGASRGSVYRSPAILYPLEPRPTRVVAARLVVALGFGMSGCS